MRIYNGTNSVMSIPLMGNERITIAPKTPSGHILCSTGIISLLITSYTTDEIALIVSGPFEISTCANVSASVSYVVQSLEEAIKKFLPKEDHSQAKVEEKQEEPQPIPTPQEENPPKEEIKKEGEVKEETPIVNEKPLRKVKDKKKPIDGEENEKEN